MHDPALRFCHFCNAELAQKDRGRYREYCSAAHRSAARRRRVMAAAPVRQEEPFAKALLAARTDAELSLRALSAALDRRGHYISVAALSQWERGRTLPHRTADGQHHVLALEGTLDLPPGKLIKPFVLTHEQRRMTAGRRNRVVRGLRDTSRTTQRAESTNRTARMRTLIYRLRREHGVDRSLLFLVEQQEMLTIGRYHRPETVSMRHTVGASGDQIPAYWYPYCYPVAEPARVDAVEGCTVGRSIDDRDLLPDSDWVVALTELRFDRPVPLGETTQFAYRLEHFDSAEQSASPAHDFKRVLTSPACRLLEMSVSFHHLALPRRLVRGTWPTSDPAGKPQSWTNLGPTQYDEITEEPPKRLAYGWTWEW
jgi:transcriptional regulator with XRE-family HTH domain